MSKKKCVTVFCVHMKSEAFERHSVEIDSMHRMDARSAASNECIIPLLNVLKPSVNSIGNPLHI